MIFIRHMKIEKWKKFDVVKIVKFLGRRGLLCRLSDKFSKKLFDICGLFLRIGKLHDV